jgi:glucose/arabinose dehydrogenase
MSPKISLPIALLFLGSCTSIVSAQSFEISGSQGNNLSATPVASFSEPWAMTFLPDGNMLVSDKGGTLHFVTPAGDQVSVNGVPSVAYGGQGGLGDVVLHPDFANNRLVYLSYAEADDSGSKFGAVVIRGKLADDGGQPALENIETVWKQFPKTTSRGHYSHRIAFGPANSDQAGMLFITSGDRQKQSPAQDWEVNLGKVMRLNDDGSVPADNPFQDKGELAKSFWSTGHRNLLGIDFDAAGRLWTHEMGPRHGDELNLTISGENYGWPVVSNGDNYSGVPIPDHDTRQEFNAPEAFWIPSIAPSGFVIYDGDVFAEWQGDGFIGGLAGQALIRVDIDGETASEAERYSWNTRVREVEQGPDGALYVLEDRGRLLKLMPAS